MYQSPCVLKKGFVYLETLLGQNGRSWRRSYLLLGKFLSLAVLSSAADVYF